MTEQTRKAILEYVLTNNPVIASTSLNVITELLSIIDQQSAALENAKGDFRDLDTICMADYKLVIGGFSRATLGVQCALTETTARLEKLAGGE